MLRSNMLDHTPKSTYHQLPIRLQLTMLTADLMVLATRITLASRTPTATTTVEPPVTTMLTKLPNPTSHPNTHLHTSTARSTNTLALHSPTRRTNQLIVQPLNRTPVTRRLQQLMDTLDTRIMTRPSTRPARNTRPTTTDMPSKKLVMRPNTTPMVINTFQ